MSRKLDKSHAEILIRIAKELSKAKEFTLAAEIYQKLGDTKSLVHMHISADQWEDVSLYIELSNVFVVYLLILKQQ